MTETDWQSAVSWTFQTVLVPLSVGLVLGLLVRPLTRMLVSVLIVGALVLLGLAALDAVSLDRLASVAGSQPMPSLDRVLSVARDAVLRFPSLIVGAALGFLLSEHWRRRQPAAR